MSFEVKIVADSINPDGKRLTTFLLTYPRFIHSEIMTHRALSKNASSSRAIPIEKIISRVEQNPARPIRWGKNGKGMQDHGEFSIEECEKFENAWLEASKSAIEQAKKLNALGLHKQIVNRVLEPFVCMTTLISGTEWENFFALRLHKDAQPEFQFLVYLMLSKYLNNTPSYKSWDEWHIPFGDNMPDGLDDSTKLKVAVARAARTSYLTMDGKIDVEKDIALHDILAESGHWSPFEHSAYARRGISGNFDGWYQYRKSFFCENRKCSLKELFEKYEKDILSTPDLGKFKYSILNQISQRNIK